MSVDEAREKTPLMGLSGEFLECRSEVICVVVPEIHYIG